MMNNETSTIEDDTTSEGSVESDIDPLRMAYGFSVSVAVVLCLIVILSMTIPLLYPRRRKNYSTYNLYLAYLAGSDLFFKSFVLYLLIDYNNWLPAEEAHFIDHPFDHAIIVFCTSANLYMNAFLAYEIYSLLRNSSRMIKHTPPSIGKVTTQAIVSYGIGIFYCLLDHFVIGDHLDVDSDTSETKQAIIVGVTLFFCAGIPMIVVVGVCVQVHRLHLIGTTRSMFGGKLRALTLYFSRIICIYMLVWLPAFVCYTIYWSPVGWMSDTRKKVSFKIAMVLVLLQVFVSFGFSWTKPDAKILLLDFFRFQYCRQCLFGGEYADYDVEPFEWDPEAHPGHNRRRTTRASTRESRFMPSDSFVRRGK